MLKHIWGACMRSRESKVEQLHARAYSLFSEFEQGGGTDYIDQAIVVGRQALKLCPRGHRKRWVSLTQLQRHLWIRHNQLGEMRDIQEATDLAREALGLCPPGDPDRSTSLCNVVACLSTRYRHLGEMADMEEAIVLGREALSHCRQGHPDRSTSLSNVADYLSTRFKKLGSRADLDEAIVLGKEALELCPRGHLSRSISLNNTAVLLFTRYQHFGVVGDLDETIILGEEALELCPQGHPNRSMCLNNLAVRLSTRYERLVDMADLERAIALAREALDLCPNGHPDRSRFSSNIQAHLSTRYKQLGALIDLDEANAFGREALELCPHGHPDRSIRLNNVAVGLSIRYNQLGIIADLDGAIVLAREMLDICPPGHPDRSTSLNNLAVYFYERFKKLGEITDIENAISLGRESLNLYPQGHPDRTKSLDSLAAYLAIRYDRLGEMHDLDEAITLARNAFQRRPLGHPDRSRSVEKTTQYLRTRFTQSNDPKDKDDFFILYTELEHLPQMVSSPDVLAAKAWVNTAEDLHHSTTLPAYETSLQLLVQHLATLPSLPQHLPILKKLTSSLAVNAFSACLRSHDPVKAVELLEQGRGVFWNQLGRLRSPLDDVIESGPAGKALADEFTRLTSLTRDVINAPGPDQHDRVCRLNLDLQKVVTNIRELPRLSRFLLPSLFSDLQDAASNGPIIIANASEYTCDALIVFSKRDPVHIPLQITKSRVRALSSELQSMTLRAKKMEKTDMKREFCRLLRDLWGEVVSPIVDFLQTTHPTGSRIWWCPTAEFSLLPLHAAGPYRTGQKNLPNLYVSSYTPALAALIRARRPAPTSSPTGVTRFLAIGQANVTGQSELANVDSELAIVAQRMEGHVTFARLEGSESCIARVSEELGKNEWVHLACHGVPNQKSPFDSAFALHDGRFTIQRIIQCELENPEFAYLSACHTTVGDEESPDEVIHLASAMQFAGFRSVIGTMWAVDDAETNRITSMFYQNMDDKPGRLDHTHAARALNRTMKSLDGLPLDQRILYVHIGA